MAFIKRAGLEAAGTVDTPGVKHERDLEAAELVGEAATRHRSLVPLANFSSQDLPDLSFATKDLSQSMARPRAGDETGVKRLARDFRLYPEAALVYDWQDEPTEVLVYSDSVWGGCAQTRRSTSGGVLTNGRHLLGYC